MADQSCTSNYLEFDATLLLQGTAKRARNPSTASEVARAASYPPELALDSVCAGMQGLSADMLLQAISCASEYLEQQGVRNRGNVGHQTEVCFCFLLHCLQGSRMRLAVWLPGLQFLCQNLIFLCRH